ncbi:class I SAM-dependent methyltransferase [Frankia sp. CNm7]|uniref:Class I SAM-dependent methyltransferase n=1 Tax=Frankia nepalensis TaxID=1836974 RepID=A0A937R7N9_9ACTN|nr:class I SAM-dependent methyltransferase [Frankia nepalensis]MBL7499630.1 class I SAM-dependent methyltransferase [Frankia nepalensis]MBL7510288.1 class I SAM-dependent methyltransferase [Frankia nepalensis]MBL7521017.1 class I SAM-dependent methyltransferase [Frankia nepalensis]MBL7626856.1 class I SAM-dependent methyltransferase [Frankia nepalensis]
MRFLLSWAPILVVVGLLLNGVRLRGRLRRLDTLPASGRPVDPDHVFVCAAGVQLTEAAKRAASYHAHRERLDVLDLVPADLTIERALDVARMVDTRTYRSDRLAPGRGAFQALLVRAEVARLAGVEVRDDYTPVELVEITERLKRHAPASTDLAVLAGVRAARDDGAMRVRVQRRSWTAVKPLNTIFPTIRDAATVVGVHYNRPWGLAATALFWCQPFFVCAGRVPVAPRDLIRSPIVRITAGVEFAISSVRAWRQNQRAAAEAKAKGLPADPAKEQTKAAAVARRERYLRAFAGGAEQFLAPPRPDCPWCGSFELAVRLRSPDLELRKPGWFQLDECLVCGHLFQNPRLTPAGRVLYERDRVDGINAARAEAAVFARAAHLRAQAELVRPFVLPRYWLDVGAGVGSFCNVARAVWPRTVFDGVGPAESIGEARRRGWVDRAYPVHFADIAEAVTGQYDVISMFGYLERSRDPSEDLDAVAKALGPGGYLVAELPNPEGLGARRLGRFWPGWGVPGVRQLIPVDNLVAALGDRGLRTVLLQFGEAHQPGDLIAAVGQVTQALAPSPKLPWLPGSPARWLLRGTVLLAAAAPALLAGLAGALLAPAMRKGERSNTYRLVARKEA